MSKKKEETKSVKILISTHKILRKKAFDSGGKETFHTLIDKAVRGFFKPNKSITY